MVQEFISLPTTAIIILLLLREMSRSVGTPTLKRKAPESSSHTSFLVDADRVVLNVIKSKGEMGIWKGDIKMESKLTEAAVTKSIKSLITKKLIKEVVNIKNKGRKHYMAAEFEPSSEVSGGAWYAEGSLDKELVSVLKELCLKIIKNLKVATVEMVFDFLAKHRVTKFDCTEHQIAEILSCMVLDRELMEVKSTGLAAYHSIPVGALCYKLSSGPKIGTLASIPCGMCPRISQCTPDGIISPTTCVYYKKWLDIEF